MKIKYLISATIILLMTVLSMITVQSCKVSQQIQYKPGALLWAENCSRCHNVPAPGDYSDSDWEVIGQHMRLRANLTADETKKIIDFLQSAN